MPYKVYKLNEDNRKDTCGWFLPNGFYHVTEMTFENYQSLVNIGSKPNYSVEYVTGKTGFFDEDGQEWDPGEVYDVLVRGRPQEEISPKGTKKAHHKGGEIEDLREQCRQLGIRFHPRAGAALLKERIERAQKRRQDSLAVG